EVYQSGPSVAPTPNGWGCEKTTTSEQTKYVKSITTDANGVVTAMVQNVSSYVNDSVVTLIPLSQASTPATFTPGSSSALYGWTCGGTGTTVPAKYLPGSCRG
ncbi:MAG: pilin, partial [Burkholderiales bacterium]